MPAKRTKKRKVKKTWGRPLLAVRLDRETIDSLRDIAKVYGARDVSDFVREFLVPAAKGDLVGLQAFLGRLMAKAGHQLELDLARRKGGAPP